MHFPVQSNTPTVNNSWQKKLRTVSACTMFAVLMVACGKTADAPPVGGGPALPDGRVPSALIQALDTNTMKSMEQRLGKWQDADASSEWRAMASGGKVRLIDETMRVGGKQHTSRHALFHRRRKTFVVRGVPHSECDDRRPTNRETVVLFKLEFQHDTLSHSEKTVDGAAQPIQPFEIENARKHSMALFDAAKSAPVTSPAKP